MDAQLKANLERIVNSPNYRLATEDIDFLARDELRPVRMQLELLKPELALEREKIRSTIVVFGGTQIAPPEQAQQRLDEAQRQLARQPDDAARQRELARAERIAAKAKYYDAAYRFGCLVSTACKNNGQTECVIMTGGGPGIMEAANRGAYDVQAKSIGLNITLPQEQRPNPFVTPELCFQFHYFALRKMHFLLRAKAVVIFPGGFGTLDELLDALTLRQTGRMQKIPVILFGRQYWQQAIDFQFLADEGVIRDEDLDLIQYAETPEEAWDLILNYHGQDVSQDY